jgi:catechol 2,3-dioxygenase-like lactoylglutathione lyase family enzyme
MATKLPTPIPQIPVSDLDRAIAFYQSRLGFALDWKYEDGIAGVSREEARLFLDRVVEGPLHPVRVWLNLTSVSEVDALYRDWHKAGVPIPSAPEQKPWGIYEFIQPRDIARFRTFAGGLPCPSPKFSAEPGAAPG